MQYKITESHPATAFWEYHVEADSHEEALAKVQNGDVYATDCYYWEDESEESEFEIEEDEDEDD